MNFKKIKHLAVAFIAYTFATMVSAEMVVIVNASNGNNAISRSELSRIFLGKASNFANGEKAIPVNQISASAIRTEFDTSMLKKSSSQIKAYWSKQLFIGNGTPPKEYNGDLDVLQRVAKDVNAIGYVDASAVNANVKVITVN